MPLTRACAHGEGNPYDPDGEAETSLGSRASARHPASSSGHSATCPLPAEGGSNGTVDVPFLTMETNGEANGRDFHGVLPPNRKIAKERADHRLAAYLFTVGLSQTEIAKRLGKTIATVSQWWRQPFMQEFIKEEMANGSRDTLSEIIKGAATDSVFTLITLRDEAKTPAAVKRQCCSELLDRAMGKAPQTVHNVGYVGDPKDIQRVDAELASMLSDRALMQSLNPDPLEPSLS